MVKTYVRSIQGQECEVAVQAAGECEVAVQAEDWFSWVVGG